MAATTTEGTGPGSAQDILVFNGLSRTVNYRDHSVTVPKLADDVLALTGVKANYGSFYSDEIQTNSQQINFMSFNHTVENYGVVIHNLTQVKFVNNGVFNIQFSAQIDKTDAGDDLIYIWLAKNNNDVPWSNTKLLVLGNNGKYVAAWNWVISVDELDVLELKWYSPDANIRLFTQSNFTNPSMPSIPSVILTVTQVR